MQRGIRTEPITVDGKPTDRRQFLEWFAEARAPYGRQTMDQQEPSPSDFHYAMLEGRRISKLRWRKVTGAVQATYAPHYSNDGKPINY